MKETDTDNSRSEISQLIHDVRGGLGTMVSALRVIERKTASQPELQDVVDLGLRAGDELAARIERLQAVIVESRGSKD